jgi:RimJ/RimL family protein N-acetyltransferase
MQHLIAYEGRAKVSLGIMQEEYIPLCAAWINRRVGIEGTLQRAPYYVEDGKEWVRSLGKQRGKDEVFAVLLKGKRKYRYIGHTGIHHIQWPDGRATTGSIFGAEKSQGRGYGTEAKLLLLYHAFMVLGIRKMESSVKAFNAQSLGHLLKCGYRIVGRKKRHCFHEGSYVDEVLVEAFREDWEPIWDRYRKAGELPKLTQTQRALVRKETAA